jgi:hypothetical protein
LLNAFAPQAFAQDADISGRLIEGVRCSGVTAKEDLGFNIKKLVANGDVIGAALNVVAANSAVCEPIRTAATELAATYVVIVPPSDEELAAQESRAVVEQTLAEAERQATQLKFEVGPPPRNKTRGRGAGP